MTFMDTNERLHHDWIGMAQPVGLVVTPSTLKAAEANITWPITELQETLREQAGDRKVVLDVPAFLREILGWSGDFLLSGAALPEHLHVRIEGSEPLSPAFAVRSADDDSVIVLLVGEAGRVGAGLDDATDDKRWTASPHQRFERLLRETGVPIGLLTNGKAFRLVYAPKGETAGWVTFGLSDMLTVDGRPLLGALHMLLNERRLLSLEPSKRLPGLLSASREYQNTVSNTLREQVLSALRELLLGFQHADRIAKGAILGDYRHGHLGEVYKGLVTVLMRSVFVLFAEEQNLLPLDRDLYATSYSLTRLYAQLAADRDRHGDTIEDRYGAWARVVALFRLLHDGVRAADGLFLPARRGDFFDPDKYPYLEGRPRGSVRQTGETLELPRISDGVVYRVLDQLLMLDGERLQYKGLDVEQVGSVYEGLMGFEVEVAEGDSLAVMPEHVVVNLETLLKIPGAERVKQLKTLANLDLKDKAAGELKAASTVAEAQAALARRMSSRQPGLIPAGSMYLQPGEERRKTGSHYTPKSLTSPIVETTLRPVLERLGPDVTPDQILDLCICDPAMGSGAFLVEACRQLADHLVAAWRRTGTMPVLPPDEDLVLHARRLVAQQCLYGVDKNPLAVDLARLSLWLVTFAREHPFTFVDHALRCGDSLVGLSREQIANLSLDVKGGFKQISTTRAVVEAAVAKAEALRAEIHAIGDPPDNERLVQLWREANEALETVRFLGDLVVAAFFSAETARERARAAAGLGEVVAGWLATGDSGPMLKGRVASLGSGPVGVQPFHWEVEFPEAASRNRPGFDCFVGNPPFAGKNTIVATSGERYIEWLQGAHAPAHGNADLAAHFFRRCFGLLRDGGSLGFLATNTIAQGDTRATGLQILLGSGGRIYDARRAFSWPGAAAVVVSVVHLQKGGVEIGPNRLDGRPVAAINSRLLPREEQADPVALRGNVDKAFAGAKLFGQGFVVSAAERDTLIQKDQANASRIQPYIGGEEVNGLPVPNPIRSVINFDHMSLEQANRWPDLVAIARARVKPERDVNKRGTYQTYWWRLGETGTALYSALSHVKRCMVVCQVSRNIAPVWQDTATLFGHTLSVFALDSDQAFAILQSRTHEAWARMFASSMKDDLRYTPSDCFDTFPFARDYERILSLGRAGAEYYSHRAGVMRLKDEGLTKTYNRFHNPDEASPDIAKLRDLHAEMDRAVLDAYGWTDIQPVYDFREQLDESIRLTWAEDTRDEVLARLLELNRVMAAKEAEGAPAAKAGKKSGGKKGKKAKGDEGTLSLLPTGEDDK